MLNKIKTKLNNLSTRKYFTRDDVHTVLMPLYLITKALAITPYVLRKRDNNFEYVKSKLGNAYCCVFMTLFLGKYIETHLKLFKNE